MTGFGNIAGDFSADAIYNSSFGTMPNKTKYLEFKPIRTDAQMEGKNTDLRDKRNMEMKALTSGGNIYASGTKYTSTSGSLPTLVPVWLDKEITDVTKFDTPLWNGVIPKVTNRGLFADWNQLTTLNTSAFKGEDAALPESDDSYGRQSKQIKFCYAVGRITGPMMAGSREWQDMLAQEVKTKNQSLSQHLEKQICRGTANDSTGFTGFVDDITTNTTDRSSGTIRISDLRDSIRTIREANGHPNLIVTDYKTLDDIKALIQNQLRYVNTTTISFGITAVEFEGVPIIVSLGMSTTATSRELHVYDTNQVELRMLQDVAMEELAKTNDSFKFMIKTYLTIIYRYEKWFYRIYGLA